MNRIILIFLCFLTKIRGSISKIYKKSDTDNAVIGFYCTWEDGWCYGWQNRDQTNDKYYDANMVRSFTSISPIWPMRNSFNTLVELIFK